MSDLTYDDAKPTEGQAFTLLMEDGRELDLTLAEVTQATVKGGRPETFRAPFSLLFRSAPGQVCSQGTYLVRNAHLGELALFIVPIGHEPKTDTYRYQAVFN